ncbi:peptide chain release factor 2 [Patescibacteria group bacterium]|nr:peptide chain release factor 2 [Patescibacteria group bacterium]
MTAFDKQIEQFQTRLKEAWGLLDLENQKHKLIQLEADMSQPDFWTDPNRARSISRQVADIQSELAVWESIKKDMEDLASMAKLAEEEHNQELVEELQASLTDLEERFRKLEVHMLFSGTYDQNSAIVSIHAGAGGTDAMDWAEMLTRMFTRFAEGKGWEVTILDSSPGEEAGYKRLTFSVKGRFAYGYLKSESGVHRLVRISPFDAEKMRHTSFALVEVMPELDEISEKNIKLDQKDLRIDTFMASGHGGQSVNTTYSAIRVTHIPTGIVATCQNERSQSQNKETALRVLKSRLFQRMQEERAEKIEELRGGHKAPEWGNQIRSYVLHPYKMVKDHRTQRETQDIEAVLDGNLEDFMEAYLRQQVGKGE